MEKEKKRKIFLSLACILTFECLIFIYTATTYVTPFYPRYFDQIQYLRESYLAFEEMRNNGLWNALYGTLKNEVAQGVWHDFVALISMSIFGPHRISALLVNFVWIVFFQIALFFTTLSLSRNISVALISFLIPLLIQGIWRPDNGGSLYDFRLDHLAMCMMGLSITACLKTEFFSNRKWSIIFGLLVGITITGRFLTVVYFGLIYILLLSSLLLLRNKLYRISNLIISGIVAAPLVIIFFFHNWRRIYDYYLIGHVVGIEKTVRASGLNIYETFLYIIFNGLFGFQGSSLFAACLAILIICFLIKKTEVKEVEKKIPQWNYLWWYIVGFVFLISPIIILSFESETQNAVLSILTPGVLVFFLGLIIPCYLELEMLKKTLAKKLLIALTILSLITFTSSNRHFPNFNEFSLNAFKINEIADYIFKYSTENNLSTKIATNRIVEFLDANIQKIVIYERHGRMISLEGALPIGNLAAATSEILNRLEGSDLAFSIESPLISRGFPSELQMQALQENFQKIYQAKFRLVSSIDVFGNQLKVYERIK